MEEEVARLEPQIVRTMHVNVLIFECELLDIDVESHQFECVTESIPIVDVADGCAYELRSQLCVFLTPYNVDLSLLSDLHSADRLFDVADARAGRQLNDPGRAAQLARGR